jgi:MFS superfamily sulfate permease-like transporter
LRELMPLALACFLLGAVETGGDRQDVCREARLPARQQPGTARLAGANLASGLGQGFPISGGMSQSLVNESGGARTSLSGLIAAGIVLVVALFFHRPPENLPQPVLAAIVLMAVASLVK